MTEFDIDEEKESDSNAWMISFADLLSLVLIFFIMFYSLSELDNRNWQNLSLSIANRFNTKMLNKETNAEKEFLADKVLDSGYLYNLLLSKIKDDQIISSLKLENYPSKTIIKFQIDEIFKYNDTELSLKGISTLYFIGNFIANLGNKIIIRVNYFADEDYFLSFSRGVKLANELALFGYNQNIEILPNKLELPESLNFKNYLNIEIMDSKSEWE